MILFYTQFIILSVYMSSFLVSPSPEMCGKLSAKEGVATEEAEDAAGSVVSAVHPLRLQLKVQLQRPVHHHIRQCRPSFEWSRAERMRLRSHVNVQPIGSL